MQSLEQRFGKRGNPLPGFHYVGCTTNPARRIRQHNGEILGGGKYTSQHRPWKMMAIFGPYTGQSEVLKAERALKHGKRGEGRVLWTPSDSVWCRGLGTADPRIAPINEACISALAATPGPTNQEPQMEPPYDNGLHNTTTPIQTSPLKGKP